MSNGLGDFPYGMVANVKASVLPYKDLGESHAMTHGASEEGHCLKGGWLLHSYGAGHVRRCCGATGCGYRTPGR